MKELTDPRRLGGMLAVWALYFGFACQISCHAANGPKDLCPAASAPRASVSPIVEPSPVTPTKSQTGSKSDPPLWPVTVWPESDVSCQIARAKPRILDGGAALGGVKLVADITGKTIEHGYAEIANDIGREAGGRCGYWSLDRRPPLDPSIHRDGLVRENGSAWVPTWLVRCGDAYFDALEEDAKSGVIRCGSAVQPWRDESEPSEVGPSEAPERELCIITLKAMESDGDGGVLPMERNPHDSQPFGLQLTTCDVRLINGKATLDSCFPAAYLSDGERWLLADAKTKRICGTGHGRSDGKIRIEASWALPIGTILDQLATALRAHPLSLDEVEVAKHPKGAPTPHGGSVQGSSDLKASEILKGWRTRETVALTVDGESALSDGDGGFIWDQFVGLSVDVTTTLYVSRTNSMDPSTMSFPEQAQEEAFANAAKNAVRASLRTACTSGVDNERSGSNSIFCRPR